MCGNTYVYIHMCTCIKKRLNKLELNVYDTGERIYEVKHKFLFYNRIYLCNINNLSIYM